MGYYGSLGEAIHHAAFQVSSIITTTGFGTVDSDLWPSLSKTILLLLMFCGACAGSTGGGIKCGRVVLYIKMLKQRIAQALHPQRVKKITMNNQPVNSESTPVSRYEASQSARIAELETEVKLRDANFYTVGEIGKLRDYVDRRFEGVNANINQQAVINAQVAANLSCMQQTIATLSGLTKTVIPITSICPEAMPRYNSWTAPTETATGA